MATLATFWAASCQGPQEFFRENVNNSGSGGAPGTGGTLTGAGGSGTGGLTATGGAPSTGGVTGTGGIVATGGVTGTGGVAATGGVKGTGGIAATGGVTGTGGIVATGGVTGTGGRATGGVTGTGGIVATGGVTGTGGVTATGGSGMAGSTGTAKNCADAIKLANYSAGTAPACSACKENGADKSMSCMKVIDCLDTNYPLRLGDELLAELHELRRGGQHRLGLRERSSDRRQLRSTVAGPGEPRGERRR